MTPDTMESELDLPRSGLLERPDLIVPKDRVELPTREFSGHMPEPL